MMQKIFKRPYLFSCILLEGIICLVMALTHKYSESVFFLILLSITIIILLLSLLLKKENKYGKLLGLLHHHCHPAAYIIEAKNLLRLEREKKRPRDEIVLQVYLSNGLYAAGKFKEAMEILEHIDIVYHYKNAVFIANYFHRKFLVSLEIERQDIAWGSLVMMRQAIANMSKRKALQMFARIYSEDMFILNVARGNYEGAEDMFNDMLKRVQTNYQRSFASYLLGGVYKYHGKEAEAKDAYEYVLAWGNKLFIADRAAGILGLNGWEA